MLFTMLYTMLFTMLFTRVFIIQLILFTIFYQHNVNFWPGLDEVVEECDALVWSLPFYLSLTGLSTGGQAMLGPLGHWSQHHLRL